MENAFHYWSGCDDFKKEFPEAAVEGADCGAQWAKMSAEVKGKKRHRIPSRCIAAVEVITLRINEILSFDYCAGTGLLDAIRIGDWYMSCYGPVGEFRSSFSFLGNGPPARCSGTGS